MASRGVRHFSRNSLMCGQVDALYQIYQSALLNRLYYGNRLHFYRNTNLGFEILLALATSGAVSTWTFWNTSLGRLAWSTFAGIAAVMCLLKPILQFSKSIEHYSNLYKGYSALYFDLRQLILQIEITEKLSERILASLDYAQVRYRNLAIDDDLKRIERIWTKCRNTVEQEVSTKKPWHPELMRDNEERSGLTRPSPVPQADAEGRLYGVA